MAGDPPIPPVVRKTICVPPNGSVVSKTEILTCDKEYQIDAEYAELNAIETMEALLEKLNTFEFERLAYLHYRLGNATQVRDTDRMRLAMDAVLYKKFATPDNGMDIVNQDLVKFTKGDHSQSHADQRAAVTGYIYDDGHRYTSDVDAEKAKVPDPPQVGTRYNKDQFLFKLSDGTVHPELTKLKQQVYEDQVYNHEHSKEKPRTYFQGIPPSDLTYFSDAVVVGYELRGSKNHDLKWETWNYSKEEKFSIRNDAAQHLKNLFDRVGDDLKAATTKDMGYVKKIGVHNAYRTAKTEFVVWNSLFYGFCLKAIPKLTPQESMDDLWALTNSDGPSVISRMEKYYRENKVKMTADVLKDYIDAKAAPGYSNHTTGVAVDFMTVVGNTPLGPEDDHAQAWMKSWFFRWLSIHAKDFHFYPLKTEPWHWDYKP